MKKYAVIVIALIVPLVASSQGFINDVFSRYSGSPNFTSISVGPEIFKLLSFLDKEDEDLQMLSKKISNIKILVCQEKSIGFTNEVRSRMNKDEYINLMEIIDGKQKVNFYLKQKGDVISDFLLLSISETEEVLVSIMGSLSMSELSNLGSSSISVEGMDHLSLLKKLEE